MLENGIMLTVNRSLPMVNKPPLMGLTVADQGNRTTPSYVAFTEGERLIGDGTLSRALIALTT